MTAATWPAAAASALAFNFASSLGVVFANKAVFKAASFTYPTALTALHYAFNYAVVLGLLARGDFKAHAVAADERWLVLLTTAVWAAHNGLSNLSLSKNSVGLYQIFKIAVTPLICLLEFACYGKRVTGLRALALAGACCGVAMATVSDVQFSQLGAAAALASACMSAVLKVLQTHLLQRRGWSSLQLMHRTWLPQLLLLLLCVPATDGLAELSRYELTLSRAAWLGLSVVCSFLLNISSLLALGETSAVAVVLLGQCKTLAIIAGGYLLFDAHPSGKTLLGAALAIASIGAYTMISLTSRVPRPSGSAEDVPLTVPLRGDAELQAVQCK